MKCKLISMLMCGLLILTVFVPAYATETSEGLSEACFVTQELEIQNDLSLSNRIKIEQLTNLFFEAKEANFIAESKTISLENFYTAEKAQKIGSDTSSKLFEFEKRVRADNCETLYHEAFEVTIENISIAENNAEVTANEYYEYMHSDKKGRLSSRQIEYKLSFVKESDGSWKISDISTNNELEGLVDSVNSVSELFANVNEVPKPDLNIENARNQALREQLTETKNSSIKSTTLTRYWYNPVKAIEYAKDYSESGTGSSTGAYNDNFNVSVGTDCQNFVSQCIWAGLGGVNTPSQIDSKAPPMITNSARNWWATSTAFSSGNWSFVPTFASYVSNGGAGIYGLYGTTGAKGAIASTYAGDSIQLFKNGGWEHTYFVVAARGVTGSRTTADLTICAHTSNRYCEDLIDIVGASAANLRTVAVIGSYY